MKHLIAALASGALLAAAGAASAAEVSVSVGPELQRHTRAYGLSQIDWLRKELAKDVQHALSKKNAAQPQRVDLVIESATPNRPTMAEMGATTGLSFSSLGLGGAVISGTVTASDGTVQPISYRWHETDFRQVHGYTTWTDADRAFDWLSSEIAHGKTPNDGPYHPDLASNAAFDSLGRLR